MIDDFQERKTQALVCTFGAGGFGFTLTKAQTVVLIDRPWTPGDAVQAEDRLHRISQTGTVTAIWLQYGTLDEQIDTLLQRKQERISLVLEGKRKTLRGIKSIRSLANELLKSIRDGIPIENLLGLAPALSGEELPAEENSIVEGSMIQEPLQPPLLASNIPTGVSPATVDVGTTRKDGRLKGQAPRVRLNIMLDAEVVDFLRSMKAAQQTTVNESGYSGFLEDLVRMTGEFQAYRRAKKQ